MKKRDDENQEPQEPVDIYLGMYSPQSWIAHGIDGVYSKKDEEVEFEEEDATKPRKWWQKLKWKN